MTKKRNVIKQPAEDPATKVYSHYMGNLIICHFMEVKETELKHPFIGQKSPVYVIEYPGYSGTGFPKPGGALGEFKQNAKFHESWDWLMPVWRKIVTEPGRVRGLFGWIESDGKRSSVLSAMGKADFQATYQGIVRYIVWLNEQADRMNKMDEKTSI